MKALIPFIVTVAVGCASHAQSPVAQPVPPPPSDEDVVIVAQAPAPKAFPTPAVKPVPPAAPARVEPWEQHLRYAEDGVRHAQDMVRHVAAGLKFGSSSSSSRRTLVIPKSDPKPELLADAEEDLNVMSLILEKALEQRSDDEGRKALGIDVLSSSSGIRNLLIEGHGAIFALKTKIALVPPPPAPKKEETKTKEERSSEWDDARRQLYGPSEIEKDIQKAWGKMQISVSSSEEYDEKKLQRLKESLTEALKSASNIRHLSGDQTVTLIVLSSSPVSELRKIVTRESSGRATVGRGGAGGGAGAGAGGGGGQGEVYIRADREHETSDNRSGSRMMLQAKKSDIDSYAKGKLTSDAFREKVKIQVY